MYMYKCILTYIQKYICTYLLGRVFVHIYRLYIYVCENTSLSFGYGTLSGTSFNHPAEAPPAPPPPPPPPRPSSATPSREGL